ncbi:MAG TPA: PilZ domain-containing protein [Rhodanobacteraceae bacterium]|nr:PilZ domain-containing protein [Rhodanobacteraceae bacterium]
MTLPQTPWQSFQERVAWEGELAVACVPLAEVPGAFEATRLERLGAGILGSLGMLGDRLPPGEGDDATRQALARVDAKLDMLVEVLNRYLLGRITLPPAHRVRLNTRGVALEGCALPAPQAQVRIELYFDGCAGMPLALPGRVVEADAPGRRFVQFHELSDAVGEGIERLVFRQQRQRLAAARQAAGGEAASGACSRAEAPSTTSDPSRG